MMLLRRRAKSGGLRGLYHCFGNDTIAVALMFVRLLFLFSLLFAGTGAVVAFAGSEGASCLFAAAKKNDAGLVAHCVNAGADVNSRNLQQETPLHWAAKDGGRAAAAALLFADADPNARDLLENAPLHWAAKYGNEKMSQDLMEAGADLNAKNFHGYTPLHLAAAENRADTAALLIQAGAKLNLRDNEGWTPLDRAWSHKGELRNFLRKNGARCGKFC